MRSAAQHYADNMTLKPICIEICPIHEVGCQRTYPHKPVKLRKEQRWLLLPNQHGHIGCSWETSDPESDASNAILEIET